MLLQEFLEFLVNFRVIYRFTAEILTNVSSILFFGFLNITQLLVYLYLLEQYLLYFFSVRLATVF